jgi:hypothetical protein
MIRIILIFFFTCSAPNKPIGAENKQPFISSALVESLSVVTGWVKDLFYSREHFQNIERNKRYESK